jgi:hypothetical protein
LYESAVVAPLLPTQSKKVARDESERIQPNPSGRCQTAAEAKRAIPGYSGLAKNAYPLIFANGGGN